MARTREHLGPYIFRSRRKFADAFKTLRNMPELYIRWRCSQASLLPSVNVDPSSPPSPVKIPSHGEGGVEDLCGTGACEYPHPISSSSIFLSLSNASANFQRDLKFSGPRGSLVRAVFCFGKLQF